jgi:lipoprotein
MKSLISTIFTMATAILVQACTANTKPVYGNIGIEGAEVYSDAAGKTGSGEQFLYGDIVEFDANENAPFIKVRNIATGVEGYVDTLRIDRAQYPLEAPEVMDEEQSECQLLNIETTDSGEINAGWVFWKHANGVKALNSVTMVYDNGRMFTTQNYYIGEIYPGYILLTEQVEYDSDKGEKLETPIVVYEDIAGRAGIFVDGCCFTPGGQLGGFDTDGWD